MRRKIIMKNTLAALLLLCSTTPALAQDKVKLTSLTSNEGKIVWFTLGQDLDKAEVPYVVVRYDYEQGNGYSISSPSSNYTFSFNANWSLELIPDPATGIDEVPATNASKQVSFSLNGRKLYIKNLPGKSSVTLYDLQGRLVMTVQADNQGCATLQLPATGLATPYVVRTASINFKIIAK